MSTDTISSLIDLPETPYPGLRPFDRKEWVIFFGREQMIEDVIERLADKQFVFVHGSSGCGKSSLIRAGVQAQLENEHALHNISWKTCSMRPGGSPMWHLAEAIAGALHPDGKAEFQQIRRIRACLNQGSNGIAEAVGDAVPKSFRLFILIDQFEEIFRHAESGGLDEAEMFVETLTGVLLQRPPGIHLIITMRSEYLGDCARFHGLPEAINEVQYLVPRMTKDELIDAITEPALLYRGEVSDRLAQRMIRDAGGDSDELPLIQHALRLMWRLAPAQSEEADKILDLNDYQSPKVENIFSALSHHADEVYDGLARTDPRLQKVAERMFRSLTDIDGANRAIRRPLEQHNLLTEIGMEQEKEIVQQVIDAFSDEACSFMVVEQGGDPDSGGLIDISHEALIRHWGKIVDKTWDKESGLATGWLYQEAEDGRVWRALVESARIFDKNNKELLSSGIYEQRLSWWSRRKPTLAWAERYENQFGLVKRLMSESKRSIEVDQKKNQLLYTTLPALIVFVLVAVVLGLLWKEADDLLEQRARWDMLRLASEARQQTTQSGRSDLGLLLNLEAWDEYHEDAEIPSELAGSLALSASVSASQPPASFPFPNGHLSVVNQVTFSPDGRWVASASDDSTVKIWDAKTLKFIKTLAGHEGWVHGVAFSPDGSMLASASSDQTIRIWDTTDWSFKKTIRAHGSIINSVAFDPDSKQLLTASKASSDGAVMLNRINASADAERIWPKIDNSDNRYSVNRALFSPDGQQILTVSNNGKARILNSKDGTEISTFETEQKLRGGAFHPKYPEVHEFATVSNSCHLTRWNSESKEAIEKIDFKFPMHASYQACGIAYHPSGKKIAVTSSNGTIGLLDLETNRQKILIHGSNYSWSVAFSPDGKYLVSGFRDGSIRLWDLSTYKQSAVAMPGKGRTFDRKNSGGIWQDGRVVVSIENENVRLTNRQGKKVDPVLSHDRSSVTMVALSTSKEASWIATGDETGGARVWSYSSKGISKPIPLSGHTDDITTAAFSPDGSQLVTGSYDDSVRLWDTASGELLIKYEDHDYNVLSVAFSQDGFHIVSSDPYRTKLWNKLSPLPLYTFQEKGSTVRWVTFSQDNQRILISYDDGNIRQRLLGSAIPEMVWKPSQHSKKIDSLGLSPDGTILASSSTKDGTVRFWDSTTGQERRALRQSNDYKNIFFDHSGQPFQFSAVKDQSGVLLRSNINEDKMAEHNAPNIPVKFSDKAIKSFVTSLDESRVAGRLSDGSVHLWNNEGKAIAKIQRADPDNNVKHGFMTLSGDGKRIALVAKDGMVTLFDTDSIKGVGIRSFDSKKYKVASLGLDHSGSKLALGDSSGNVHLLSDNKKVKEKVLHGDGGPIFAVVFSPNGKVLAVAGKDGKILLWNLNATNKKPLILKGHTSIVSSVAFSPDGSRLASGSHDHTVCVWNSTKGIRIKCHSEHNRNLHSVAFSPDGKRIASAGYDHKILIWNYETDPTASVTLKALVRGVLFNPLNGTQVVSIGGYYYNTTIQIWDTLTRKITKVLEDHTDSIRSIFFTPDGAKIIAANHGDNTIREWDPKTSVAKVLYQHPGNPSAMGISAKGETVALGYNNGTIMIFDGSTGERRHELKEENLKKITALAFGKEGTRLVSSSQDGNIRLWDSQQGTILASGPGANITSLLYEPNDKRIFGGKSNGTIAVWTVDGETLNKSLLVGPHTITAIAFGKNDENIELQIAKDKTLVLNLKNGLIETKKDSAVTQSTIQRSDGEKKRCLASLPEGGLKLTNCFGKTIASVPHVHETEIITTQFMGDGPKTVMSASSDGEIIVWEFNDNNDTLRQLAVFKVPEGKLSNAAVSHDGQHIAATNDQGVLYLYKRPEYDTWDKLLQHARQLIKGQELSTEEKKKFHLYR